jgi:hypothetical protein
MGAFLDQVRRMERRRSPYCPRDIVGEHLFNPVTRECRLCGMSEAEMTMLEGPNLIYTERDWWKRQPDPAPWPPAWVTWGKETER